MNAIARIEAPTPYLDAYHNQTKLRQSAELEAIRKGDVR